MREELAALWERSTLRTSSSLRQLQGLVRARREERRRAAGGVLAPAAQLRLVVVAPQQYGLIRDSARGSAARRLRLWRPTSAIWRLRTVAPIRSRSRGRCPFRQRLRADPSNPAVADDHADARALVWRHQRGRGARQRLRRARAKARPPPNARSPDRSFNRCLGVELGAAELGKCGRAAASRGRADGHRATAGIRSARARQGVRQGSAPYTETSGGEGLVLPNGKERRLVAAAGHRRTARLRRTGRCAADCDRYQKVAFPKKDAKKTWIACMLGDAIQLPLRRLVRNKKARASGLFLGAGEPLTSAWFPCTGRACAPWDRTS